MLSQFSRRAALIARRTATNPVTIRMVSTATYAQVQAMEKVFDHLHWHDARDKVEEIRELMDEHKTNQSIKTPTPDFEQMVTDQLHEIQDMAAVVGTNHEELFHRVFEVKDEVKHELYQQN